MQSWLAALVIKIITSPQVRDMLLDLLGRLVAERFAPLIPVAVKAAVDQVITKTPALSGVVDLVEVAQDTRHALDRLIPDVDWGPLDGIIDAWRPR